MALTYLCRQTAELDVQGCLYGASIPRGALRNVLIQEVRSPYPTCVQRRYKVPPFQSVARMESVICGAIRALGAGY